MAPKQLRLLKGDSKFFKKIARAANEDHLLARVIAEAMRVGILACAVNPSASSKRLLGLMEKKMETIIVHWGYIGIMVTIIETTIMGLYRV